MIGIFVSFVLVSNGKLYHAFMELQALSMIDFRNGKAQAYLEKCGKLVYWSKIIKEDYIGSDYQLKVL